MCLARVGRVVTLERDGLATVVEPDGRRVRVSLAPIVLDGGTVAAGDWVVFHTGLAVDTVDAREALALARDLAGLTETGGSVR